jgi:hypothetical protein
MKNKISLFTPSLFLPFSLSFLPSLAFAQNNLGIDNPLSVRSLPELINVIVQIIRPVAIAFLVLAIMYTGYLFVMAQGKAEEISTARKALFWTMLGGLIILSATAITAVFQNSLN